MAGECDQGRDHVGGRGNIAHDDTTAGATLDLETVGQSLPSTEVDEVGRISERLG